jgi:hypothetical protein
VRHRGQFTAGDSSSASASNSSAGSALPQSDTGAQSQERAEKAVQITSGPTVTADSTGQNATMTWTTNNVAANQVKYRPVSGGNWKTAYDKQGSKNHSLQLSGLTAGQTYEYQILTRDGDVRTSGQFTASPGASASAAGTSASANPSAAASTAGNKVPLYRAFNSTTGAHAYSTSQSSFPSGFTQEAVAGYVMSSQAQGTVPLYALTSPKGDYFYTSSDSERRNAVSKLGYQDQGPAGYVMPMQQSGTVPLYRMVNTANGQHFYTADPNEHSKVLAQGMKDEGIAGYVWQQ